MLIRMGEDWSVGHDYLFIMLLIEKILSELDDRLLTLLSDARLFLSLVLSLGRYSLSLHLLPLEVRRTSNNVH